MRKLGPYYYLMSVLIAGVMALGCEADGRHDTAGQTAQTQPMTDEAATPTEAVPVEPAPSEIATLAPTDEYDVKDSEMSCEDANRFAPRAVERLGYEVTSFTQASTDTPGLIEAKQRASWGEDEPVSVSISCSPQGVHIAPRSEIPPCEQANKVMHNAVESSGFTITKFTPASLIKAGVVEGKNDKGETTAVSITCYIERNRVEMDTSEDSPLLANIDFYQALSDFQLGFFTALNKYIDDVRAQSTVGNQIQVMMRLFDAVDAQVVFGMESLDPLPVKVVIANPTQRTYKLEVERVMLIAASGGRVKPLGLEGATFPTAPLTDRSITPGSNIEGYLFYPAGTYSGARGSVADEKSNEREGFSLEFTNE